MKILFSGTSSFTGYWFSRTLAEAGHEVVGLFRGESEQLYEGEAKERVLRFQEFGRAEFGQVFGSPEFLTLIESGVWDLYAHHASDVTNYRAPSFDPVSALRANVLNLPEVLQVLKEAGCSRLVFTGSVFEGGEGAGCGDLPHISRYGLSKALSWEFFRHECHESGFHLGKFVIPNPFGPWEQRRFTHYLAKQWSQGLKASVRTPDYVRDNIPVDLLALEYRRFVESLPSESGLSRLNPSGYVESQGQFARRFAREMAARTPWNCDLEPTLQSEFSEPMMRVNTSPSARFHPEWSEDGFWTQVAEYYLGRFS